MSIELLRAMLDDYANTLYSSSTSARHCQHALYNTGWPLVPNHIDLPENNIHVDPGMLAGSLGICDWRGAQVRPFGTALGLIEVAPLDTLTTSGDFWRYHSAHEELRAHFWTLFYGYCGGGAAGGGQAASGDCEARGSLFDSWVTGQCNVGRQKRGAAGLGFLWAVLRHGDSLSAHATTLRALES
ncbi:hypothetical protein BBO_00984 [Beauveria brongniartii RCEF 3172]|uniref:Aminoglycoside phosphotransferase domain-containing protein n=1 Tax=Beauveria brongniartii RCEF 3172 TaxID=1081107 RepID=A0A167K033_9HYPO|nr:hypothetical protein BBO_00984 [Beauveria brongniartii RCEF 3172]